MKIFYFILLASLLNLDNVSAFQFLISRPSFAGGILGYLSGYTIEGFLIGLLLELVILDFTPVGGIPIPNGTLAALVSVLLIRDFGRDFAFASFFAGIIAGEGYSYVEKFMRSFRNIFNRLCENMIEKNDFNFGRLVVYSLIIDVMVFGIYSFISYKILYFIFLKINSNYLMKVFRLAVVGAVFVTLTSLYFKFKTQVGKND